MVQGVIVTVAVAAVCVVTAGAAAPAIGVALYGSGAVSFTVAATVSTTVASVATGAMVGAGLSFTEGLLQNNVSPDRVLEDAGLGALGGAASGLAGAAAEAVSTVPWGNTATLASKTIAQVGAGVSSSSFSSYEKTGTVTPATIVGGAFFGAAGAQADLLATGEWGNTFRAGLVSTGTVNAAENIFGNLFGIQWAVMGHDKFLGY